MNIVNLFMEYRVILEILVAVVLFTYWMPRRGKFWLRLGGAAVILGMAVVFWQRMLPKHNAYFAMAWQILLCLVCAGVVWFLYEVHVSDALFYVTAAAVFQQLAYKLASLLYYIIFIDYGYGYELIMEHVWLYAILTVLVYALLAIVVAVPLNKTRVTGTKSFTVTCLMLGMLFSVTLFQSLFVKYGIESTPELYLLLMLFGIISCFFMLILQVQITRKWKSEKENDMFRYMLRQQREQMKMSKETIELINVKCHDMNKMIASIGNQLSQEDLRELSKTINIYSSSVKTGNEALDILLAEKSLLCEQKGIQLNCMVDGTALNFMHAVDVYALFRNALDNAIEAVLKLEDEKRRYIGVRVANQSGMLMIRVENRYLEKPVYKDGVIQTRKRDKDYHGFGIRSMEMIAEKYGGSLSVNVGEEMFCICILLPPNGGKATEKCI